MVFSSRIARQELAIRVFSLLMNVTRECWRQCTRLGKATFPWIINKDIWNLWNLCPFLLKQARPKGETLAFSFKFFRKKRLMRNWHRTPLRRITQIKPRNWSWVNGKCHAGFHNANHAPVSIMPYPSEDPAVESDNEPTSHSHAAAGWTAQGVSILPAYSLNRHGWCFQEL